MTAELSVVVPVYNEEKRLGVTLDGLTEALRSLTVPAEVVVVDNASEDASADIARARAGGPVPVRLLRCEVRGKGAAVRAGVLGTQSRLVGFCDADLATDLSALDPTLRMLGAGVNVVIGSRAHPDSDVQARHSLARQAGAWVFRTAARQVVPALTDTQCGYKFFDRATADAVFRPLSTKGFTFDVEVLARAQRRGSVIAEIPVTWVDVPGSTFSPLRDGYSSFAELARIQAVLAAEQAPAVGAPRALGALAAAVTEGGRSG